MKKFRNFYEVTWIGNRFEICIITDNHPSNYELPALKFFFETMNYKFDSLSVITDIKIRLPLPMNC
uniref:Uncharacterized protein n=1 Tax=Rhizophagus irregularis (strain DAOM 181602 / DAOM 197198 / MUCL 43194) TaxID=747089 RepID=U9TE22_RHIID